MTINLNGRLHDGDSNALPHDSRAFRYGYGLFETMRYQNGHIQLEDYHWERLFAGMRQTGMEAHRHFTPAFLAAEVRKTVMKNKLDALCRVRLQVWPGGGGLYDAMSFAPHFLIECFPLQPEAGDWNSNGLVLGIAEGLYKSADQLANLKSCNAMIYAVAARQAKTQQWNDALIRNTAGNLIESTIANVFWVKDQAVFTPPLTEGCVNGVMRRHILHILNTQNVAYGEQPLSSGILAAADEVFLTNAIRKIQWIKRIGDIGYSAQLSRELVYRL